MDGGSEGRIERGGRMSQRKKKVQTWWAIKKKSGRWADGRQLVDNQIAEGGGPQLFYQDWRAKDCSYPLETIVKIKLVEVKS